MRLVHIDAEVAQESCRQNQSRILQSTVRALTRKSEFFYVLKKLATPVAPLLPPDHIGCLIRIGCLRVSQVVPRLTGVKLG
jgi:hypothetical protein